MKFKYGDFIHLSPNAEVYDSLTGELLPEDILRPSWRLWAVDHYEEESGMLNVNRVLRPYPGAYCSWVHEKYVTYHERHNEGEIHQPSTATSGNEQRKGK